MKGNEAMEDRITALELRLEAAEQRAVHAERRTKHTVRCIAFLAAITGVVAFGWSRAGAAPEKPAVPLKISKVTAPFEVVDSSGRLLMIVENASPAPHLQLFGNNGRPVVTLGSGMNGGGKITISDRAGKPSFEKP